MKKLTKQFWRNNKSYILFIALMLVFRSAVADWNVVPTGSMKPTIVEGDRIFVNKLAYDLRLPFTYISLHKIADPEYNDIIIFDSGVSDKKLVKRVIGVPGDIVAMNNNQLTINGEKLDYKSIASKANTNINDNINDNTKSDSPLIVRSEQLSTLHHRINIKPEGSTLSSFSPVTVPENSYLVLGDNRDNSADSRVIGFVPRSEILGKANTVIVSLNNENYYLPRSDRFFKSL